MKYIFLILSLVSDNAYSEIYKCEGKNGSISFSDSPCPQELAQEVIETKKTDWVSELKVKKSGLIKIKEIVKEDGDITISYNFKSQSDSQQFMKLAQKLSNMPVVLMKIIMPKGKSMGMAEIKASNKPNPLFDKFKNANK